MTGPACAVIETFSINKEQSIVVNVLIFAGSVLIFQHDIWHKGSQVQGGVKYCMRTDVMYTREDNL